MLTMVVFSLCRCTDLEQWNFLDDVWNLVWAGYESGFNVWLILSTKQKLNLVHYFSSVPVRMC